LGGGSEVLDVYETSTLTLDGFFTGGVLRCTRIGRVVTISATSQVTSASAVGGTSTATIGVDCRPANNTENIYLMETDKILRFIINASGTVTVFRLNHSGVGTANTNWKFPTISYTI
jgi:hypothetical protein